MTTITMQQHLGLCAYEIHAEDCVDELGQAGAARWAMQQLEPIAARALWGVLEFGTAGAWKAWARERLTDTSTLEEAAALEIIGHLVDGRRTVRDAAREQLGCSTGDLERLRDLHLLAQAVGARVDATMPEDVLCEQIDAAVDRLRLPNLCTAGELETAAGQAAIPAA